VNTTANAITNQTHNVNDDNNNRSQIDLNSTYQEVKPFPRKISSQKQIQQPAKQKNKTGKAKEKNNQGLQN
jgi:hypothetical protein